MFKSFCKYWFRKKGWRFVGRLPKLYDKNLIIVTPFIAPKDYKFFIALSSLTGIPVKLFIKQKRFVFPINIALKKHQTFPLPAANEFKANFKELFLKQKRINIAIVPPKPSKSNSVYNPCYDLSKELNIPIILLNIDHVEKMVKFHTVFFASQDENRDIRFISRYFCSQELMNNEKRNSF